jgi:hypothetical protein
MEGRPLAIQRSVSMEESPWSESTVTSERFPVTNEAQPELGQQESRAVNRTKGLVYIVIFFCAIAVGFWSHYELERQDLDNFRVAYLGFATELLEGSERNVLQAFSRLQVITDAITSHADVWPAATLPNFDVRTTPNFESETDPELFLFAPMVTNVTKRDWEAYAWERQGWIQEDLSLRGLDTVDPGTIPRRIHPFFGDDNYDLDEIDKYGTYVLTDGSLVLVSLFVFLAVMVDSFSSFVASGTGTYGCINPSVRSIFPPILSPHD